MDRAGAEVVVSSSTYQRNRWKTLSDEVIERHRGKWLALSPDGRRVVASSGTFDGLMELVRGAGENDGEVHIVRVPENDEGMPLGGLELQ